MENSFVEVEILESSSDRVKVKMPFLDIPIDMNRGYLDSKLKQGYWRLRGVSTHS